MNRKLLFLAVSAAFAGPAGAQALPTGGTTTAGSASIGAASGGAMTVTQTSQRAIIDWTTFSIGSGGSVTFSQPGAASVMVNRVGPSGGASAIDGSLGANGHVMILNPNGVMFGPTASVNVGGLIASTGSINDAQFMASDTAPIAITGALAGAIANQGQITVSGAGLAAFVAPSVSNAGTIRATSGRIMLAAAQAATVSFNGGLYEIAVDKGIAGGSIANTGTLAAAGGTVVLSALDAANVVSGAINLQGVQQASRIEVHGGQVVLLTDLDAATVTGTSRSVSVGGSGSIQDGIDISASGATVSVGAGTYTQTRTLNVNKALTLAGAGEGQTFIDARGVSGYGMLVDADHVALSDFTLYGPAALAASSYGIKVQPAGSAASSRLSDFSISRVTSRGAGRAELDLNGVVGATIDHVTADGAPYGAASGTTPGAGIQVTDSANVTITNSTTRNNAWGGVALYQTNRFYDQQVTGITVATSNSFTEVNPLYLQRESATLDYGTLSLPGFSYAVRNGSSVNDNFQYTWMQQSAQGAFDFAVNVPSSGESFVQGWNGSALTQDFRVGVGHLAAGGLQSMSIMAAIDAANAGATVSIYPGSYTETAVDRTIPGLGGTYTLGLFVYKDGLTLRGVDAAGNAVASADGVQAWIRSGAITNFGMAHGIVANNVTIEGLGFKPYASSLNKTIEIQADNFTFRNSVVDNRFEGTGGTTVAGGAGALYFGENDPAGHQIERLTVTGNKFYDGSVVLTNGVGVAADDVTYQPAADRLISGNAFIGSENYRFGGLLMNGEMAEIPWRLHSIGAATLVGNRFSGLDESVLVRGDQQGIDLREVMRDNSFDRAVLVTDAAGNARGELYQSTPDGTHFTPRLKYSIQSSLQAGVDRAADGDSVAVGSGTYAENVVVDGRPNLSFDHATLLGLTVNGAGAGIGGSATANGSTGFVFNAPVQLLADTSLSTAGASIVFNGDIQNAGGRYALALAAGSGDVLLTSGGSASDPLGMLTIASNNLRLTGTLWVSGYDIDALGAVALSNHTLRQVGGGVSNTINAGSGVTGSTISEGDVAIQGGAQVAATVTASSVVIDAPSVNVTINATGAVQIHSDAPVSVAGSAPALLIDSPGGSVTGSFGQVSNAGTGLVSVNGRPQPNATLSASAENNRVLPREGSLASAGASAAAGQAEGGEEQLDEERRRIVRAGVPQAPELLRRGLGVELDLAPGR